MDRRNNRRTSDGNSVVTANSLLNGRVVWLDHAGQWQDSIACAQIFPNHQIKEILDYQAGKAFAKQVVGVYGVQIQLSSSGPEPITIRERIRAFGPGVYTKGS